jgi:c(7)-type cytochrome triheme protein
MRPASRLPRPVQLTALVLLPAVLLGGTYLVLASRTQAVEQPPLDFNHRAMVQAGIPCLFCHPDALKSPAAGMPSVEKCMGCHTIIATDDPGVKKLAAYWDQQEPILWPRVNQLPRFVYFSHQVHIGGGLNCERCHGDVGQMSMARPVVKMDMGWCLDCHEQQANAVQLKNCMVCHQ